MKLSGFFSRLAGSVVVGGVVSAIIGKMVGTASVYTHWGIMPFFEAVLVGTFMVALVLGGMAMICGFWDGGEQD